MKFDVIIIGAGPAGLYAADELNKQQMSVAVIDKGREMEDRECPESKACNCKICDILCGIGGAGGFSDGKNTLSLTRGTQGEELFPRTQHMLDVMERVDAATVRFSGTSGKSLTGEEHPEEAKAFCKNGFSFNTYPLRHIGSDGMRAAIIGMRANLAKRGVEFFSRLEVKRILTADPGRVVTGVETSHGYLWSNTVMAASGLDGSPWLHRELVRLGAKFTPGAAGIGMRLETPASVMDPLFDTFYDWKLERGRLRSFCCNNRGYIVNENHASLGVRNVNGHSYLDPKRKSDSSNCCILSKIRPDEVGTNPQEAVVRIGRRINGMAGGHTVVQLASDFAAGRASAEIPRNPFRTNFQSRPGGDIGEAIGEIPGLRKEFQTYLIDLGKMVPGILDEYSLVYGPEIKYYSPRVVIDSRWEAKGIRGLYVVGNASGYLDSFVAAAMSGVMAAEAIRS